MIVVCKILRVGEASDFRGIFSRYNPWMQGLYSLLVEYKKNFCQLNKESDKIIYNEIQLVLKNTQLNENQIRESTLFRDLSNKETRNNELNHILRKIANSPYIVVPEISEEDVQEEDFKEEDLENMPDDFNSERVNIDESSEKFSNIDPKILKSLVIRGINYAMKEIIDAVIRRVIPIASITTRSLVLKDFALETDPSKLKSAAEITSKSLAGMLALITCKDILKYQFMKSLKDLVYSSQNQQVRSLDDQGKKELIELLSKENSEIGCKQIIDEVKKQALSNIEKDDSINQEIAKRQKYQHDGIEFRDLSVLHQFNRLPEILRPQEAGLTDPEYQVYQDYDGIEDMIESVLEDPDEAYKAPEVENPYSGQMNQAQKQIFHLCKLFLNKGNVRDYEATIRNEIEQIRAYIQSDNSIEDLISESILAVENISFNPNLMIFLIESKVVSLSSWEKRFAFFINGTPMNFSKPSIIEFMEMFIIRGILEKKLFTNEDIPELYSIIESYSSSQNNVASTKWN